MSSGPLQSPIAAGGRSMRWLATSILFLAAACSSGHPAWPKIGFDLTKLDAEGLTGGAGALRALHYEFCVPAGERHAAEVRSIDATAQFMPRSRAASAARRSRYWSSAAPTSRGTGMSWSALLRYPMSSGSNRPTSSELDVVFSPTMGVPSCMLD